MSLVLPLFSTAPLAARSSATLDSEPCALSSGVRQDNPESMARRYNVPYLGRLPMDSNLLRACEEGVSFLDAYPDSVAAVAFETIVNRLISDLPVSMDMVEDGGMA